MQALCAALRAAASTECLGVRSVAEQNSTKGLSCRASVRGVRSHQPGYSSKSLAPCSLQARIEEVGQGLLRRTQEASGLGIRRKGQRSRFHMDAYEEHMLLPEVGHPSVLCFTSHMAMQTCSTAAGSQLHGHQLQLTANSARGPNLPAALMLSSLLTSGVDPVHPDGGRCMPHAAGAHAGM